MGYRGPGAGGGDLVSIDCRGQSSRLAWGRGTVTVFAGAPGSVTAVRLSDATRDLAVGRPARGPGRGDGRRRRVRRPVLGGSGRGA